MEPITAPQVPKGAFNKFRPVSDLIRAQTDHLKHLEEKMTAQQRASIPQHGILTENDAALYVAAMTRILRGGVVATATVPTPITSGKRRAAVQRPVDLAASVETTDAATPAKSKKLTAKAKKP